MGFGILGYMADNEPKIAVTPEPPYVAVIFTSLRTPGDAGYGETAGEMEALAAKQPGYLGVESARDTHGLGITVSYWRDEESARGWKRVAEHRAAQRSGRDTWYRQYQVRVATVAREYGFTRQDTDERSASSSTGRLVLQGVPQQLSLSAPAP
jgi:heme-degrading monooxygenase HmoA